MNIYIDPRFDLHQAGLNTSDKAIESFMDAYREAAERLSAHRNETIVVRESDAFGAEIAAMSDDDLEIWQDLHNMVEQIGPEEWRWSGEVRA